MPYVYRYIKTIDVTTEAIRPHPTTLFIEQEVLGRSNRLYSLDTHGPYRKQKKIRGDTGSKVIP
jgi:hypothetical protein